MTDAPQTPPAGDLAARLRMGLSRAIHAAFPGLPEAPDPLLSPTKNPELGDYQSNAAMGLAKKLGKPPREVAQAIVASSAGEELLRGLIEPLTSASIAGPGFLNIRLATSGLAQQLEAFDAAGLGVATLDKPQTIVVDLMGVNLAKIMHVGHLRSPVIGDAIARMLERLGHRVLRQNHVGDWGLNIAMTISRLRVLRDAGRIDMDALTLDELDKAYAFAQRECQRDLAGLEAARTWNMGPKAIAELEEQVDGATEAFLRARSTLLSMQGKEAWAIDLWQRVYAITMSACLDVCKALNVAVDDAHTAGESTYADELAPLVQDLTQRGIAVEDAGALIVRLDAPPMGKHGTPLFEPIREPCLVRKTDGGFLYATTDIAACRRRVQQLGASRAIYVIDARQNLHLRQVFASSALAGYLTMSDGSLAQFEHAAFGSVLGPDGRPFKTRSGENVKLQDLLSEVFAKAREVVAGRAGDRATNDEAQLEHIAWAVGVAALKYADLSADRAKDTVFSLDKMIAFEGDTGPYLLYAVVRVKRIRARAGTLDDRAPLVLMHPSEKALAMTLLRYPSVLRGACDALEPHRLCGLLYEIARACASFYDQCPVLEAPTPEVRASRLRLCGIAERVLVDGLSCLGIPVLERM